MISQSLYLFALSQTRGLILISIISRDSFTNLSRWLADARTLASPHLVVVLVGNKSDREDDREVEWAEASRWAAENGALLSSDLSSSSDILTYYGAQMCIFWKRLLLQAKTSKRHSFLRPVQSCWQ